MTVRYRAREIFENDNRETYETLRNILGEIVMVTNYIR